MMADGGHDTENVVSRINEGVTLCLTGREDVCDASVQRQVDNEGLERVTEDVKGAGVGLGEIADVHSVLEGSNDEGTPMSIVPQVSLADISGFSVDHLSPFSGCWDHRSGACTSRD
jgi:hypothetical protein